MKSRNICLWIVRIIAAIIMLQTLYFKFAAHPEAVYIFTTLGLEPWGRIGIGVMELIASLLILVPRTSWLGALIGMGLISGAIFFHLTKLGIVVYNDGGKLFVMAVGVFICSAIILWFDRREIPVVGNIFQGASAGI